MSDFKIRFRDPQSGRQLEVEAEQKKAGWSEGPVSESFEKDTQETDGKVDVMLKNDYYWWSQSRHLGIDTKDLSQEDAAALKRALDNPTVAGLSVFGAQGAYELEGVSILKTDAAGELAALSDNLDTTGTRREVQLTPSGHIATPDGSEPQTPAEVGEGLFRAASLIDDVKGNLFDQIEAPLALKEKMFANLSQSLEGVAPGQPLPQGMDETQALQMRSSGATTLLELMTSKQNNNTQFKSQALDAYVQMIEQESNPLLKDSMVFNLNRLQGALPSALRDRVDGLMETIAPTKPPYEKWFADGDNTVDIAFVAGDSETYKGALKMLPRNGFELAEDNGRTATFTRTIEHDGKETKFELKMRYNSGNMYNEINDEDVDVLVYSGHSNWGRNVRDSLARAPEGSGEGKLLLTDLCVGKGEIQMTRDHFPDAHLITTYNSSYYRPNDDSEGMHALANLVEGIARREGYNDISENVRRDNPWGYSHRRSGVDNNFIFPTDLETRRRVLDQDHDGQADVFDRMVNFNAFQVKEDTAREFQAIEPSRDADALVGTKIHFASQTINRMALYSGVLKSSNSTGEVVPAGYFKPEPGETGLFRFEKIEDNGRETVRMSMNSNYAHMSEEALRMAASYEYGLFVADQGDVHLDPQEAKLNAMVFASHSLYTDKGYRDSQVWSAFTEAYGLSDISRRDVESAKKADDHYYSGSHASIDKLKETLSPEVLEALLKEDVGVLQP